MVYSHLKAHMELTAHAMHTYDKCTRSRPELLTLYVTDRTQLYREEEEELLCAGLIKKRTEPGITHSIFQALVKSGVSEEPSDNLTSKGIKVLDDFVRKA